MHVDTYTSNFQIISLMVMTPKEVRGSLAITGECPLTSSVFPCSSVMWPRNLSGSPSRRPDTPGWHLVIPPPPLPPLHVVEVCC